MSPKHVLDKLVDMAIDQRIGRTELEIEDRVRRGVKAYMPGALMEKLTPEERELLKELRPEDFQNYHCCILTMSAR